MFAGKAQQESLATAVVSENPDARALSDQIEPI
jgi:hypothetical protein